MAQVLYNSCALIPGPHVSITSNVVVGGDQRRIGKTYNIVIEGVTVSFMGSPQGGSLNGAGWGGPGGLFWQNAGYPPNEAPPLFHKLYQTETKQQAIENLFATDGQWLEFDSPDGSAPLKCQPKNFNIVFAEGTNNWVNTCPYTITCEADILYLNGETYQGISASGLVQSASESWDFQPAEVINTFSVSHTVSAVGKRTFDSLGNQDQDSWQVAKSFVDQNLILGFTGASAFSVNGGQTIFDQSSLASGVINFASLSPYNFSRAEQVDEIGGSYSVTESWILATGSGTDAYVINLNQIVEEPYTTTQATIQGTLRGFYTNLFDYNTRILSAEYMWSQLQGNALLNRVNSYVQTSYASGLNLNQQPIAAVLDYDYNAGSITYNMVFNNRLFEGDAFDFYTVTSKRSAQDYKTQFTVAGQTKGRKYQTDTDPTLAYTRANTYFQTIDNSFSQYSRVTNYFPYASGIGLQIDPIDRSIGEDPANGVIEYQFTFDNRALTIPGVSPDNVVEDFNINSHFSVEDGITTYVIAGTIEGLNISDGANPQQTKFAAASGYFYSYVVPNLYTRVVNYYNISLPNPIAQSIEIGTEPTVGRVSYSYGFDNKQPPMISGVYSEHITISTVNKNATINVFGQIPIIGRGISGPILQNMNASPVKEQTLSIETILMPLTGVFTSLLQEYLTIPNYDYVVSGVVPNAGTVYVSSDQDSYDPRFRRYTRTVSWVYE